MYALEGGNIGFQLGGQATDFVLLVMNSKGAVSIPAAAGSLTSALNKKSPKNRSDSK